MNDSDIPEWMEYGICKVCEDLIRIEEAYDHRTWIKMEYNWYGNVENQKEEVKNVELWCSEECKVTDNL